MLPFEKRPITVTRPDENSTGLGLIRDVKKHLLARMPGLVINPEPVLYHSLVPDPDSIILVFSNNSDNLKETQSRFQVIVEVIDWLCQKHGWKKGTFHIVDEKELRIKISRLTPLVVTENLWAEVENFLSSGQVASPEISDTAKMPKAVKKVVAEIKAELLNNKLSSFRIRIIRPENTYLLESIQTRLEELYFYQKLYSVDDEEYLELMGKIADLRQQFRAANVWLVEIDLQPADHDYSIEFLENIDLRIDAFAKNIIRYDAWLNDGVIHRSNNQTVKPNYLVTIKLDIYTDHQRDDDRALI